MPLGYFGYLKLGDPTDLGGSIFLLTNSGGLNRQVSPILSESVWGAGWHTGATHTNYADGQQHFEGSVSFELQGIPSVWNMIVDWAIEQRVTPKSAVISPNGINIQKYEVKSGDFRTGTWLNTAGINIAPDASIKLDANIKALRREETATATSYKAIKTGPGTPTAPLNPGPGYNQNPFPGWSAITNITWPGSPTIFSDTNTGGFVLMNASFNYNNNTQIIKGITGDQNPAAVVQGTMAVEGTLALWMDGAILDPYDPLTAGGPFTASGANISMVFGKGSGIPQILIAHVLLTSDEFTIQAQNTPSTRTFGFSGLGDGSGPPMVMSLSS
jgi:hypothetical protein